MNLRKGFSVVIKREDGSEFLCCSDPGILPPVFVQRKWAVQHKRKLIAEGFTCRVVPVTFANVEVVP